VRFFGDEPAPRPSRPPAPAWVTPPEHVLGVSVALNVVVARGESAVVAVTDALAYPDGVVLGVLALRREAARHRGLVPSGGTTVTADAAPLLEAAARATALWPGA
jgi:hypothetical protein